MMSVSEEARKAQTEAFERAGVTGELRDLTVELYDGMDGLSSGQRNILISQVLNSVKDMARHIMTYSDNVTVVSLAQTIDSISSVAGYTNELTREASGETSTGDAVVTGLLQKFADISSKNILRHMPEDQQARLAVLEERLKARLADGEDYDTAIDAMMREDGVGREDIEHDLRGRKVEDAPSTGMYL